MTSTKLTSFYNDNKTPLVVVASLCSAAVASALLYFKSAQVVNRKFTFTQNINGSTGDIFVHTRDLQTYFALDTNNKTSSSYSENKRGENDVEFVSSDKLVPAIDIKTSCVRVWTPESEVKNKIKNGDQLVIEDRSDYFSCKSIIKWSFTQKLNDDGNIMTQVTVTGELTGPRGRLSLLSMSLKRQLNKKLSKLNEKFHNVSSGK